MGDGLGMCADGLQEAGVRLDLAEEVDAIVSAMLEVPVVKKKWPSKVLVYIGKNYLSRRGMQ